MEEITTEKKYWTSLEQLTQDPQFVENSHKEFLTSPLQEEEDKDGIGRRDFMKLMAASTALATTACFQRPMKKILPYVNQPEEITFGVANYYASTCTECAASCGTLVKTREGRPIKLEGNPDHPMSKGGLCARGQASILNLYDPDRLRNPVLMAKGTTNYSATTWKDADMKVISHLKSSHNGQGQVRILTGTVTSPSQQKLITEFLSGFKNGQHVVYEPLNNNTLVAAQELTYGTKVLPRFRFDKADVIVSIDADFLGTWLSPVEFTKQFSTTRKLSKKKKDLSKLIVFESTMSLTGCNADERVAIRPEDAEQVALAILNELVVVHKSGSLDGDTTEALKNFSATAVADRLGITAKSIKDTAKELAESRGKSLVVTGSTQSQTENGLGLNIAVNLINSVLGNDGKTIDYDKSPSLQNATSSHSMSELISDMKAGKVDVLLIHNTNPVFTLPADAGFVEAAKKVNYVVSFNDRVDETAVVADVVCPDNHGLEKWGDAQPQRHLYSLIQPTIQPIYDTRAFEDSLLAFNKTGNLNLGKLSQYQEFHDYVQTYWRENIYKEYGISVSFESFWESALRDGVLDGATKKGVRESTSNGRTAKSAVLKAHLPKSTRKDGFSLAFYAPISLGDGRNGNNPWLHELPDPVSRAVWDNYASVSPKAAAKMGLKDGDTVKIKSGSTTFEIVAHVQPGLHENVVAVALGYGRKSVGVVGNDIGQNMFQYVKFNSEKAQYSGFDVTVTRTGAKYRLATSQNQHTLEGRPIVKEATLKEFIKNPHAGNEDHEHLTTLWSGHDYKGYRWGMSIDLNSCTGCNACVIGCQSENNVPVVGKEAVASGRIMHWIRIDRYYTGTPDNPQVVHQPMLCQHCENAPCETVCPVLATTHDEEGLNQQTYNRCVGTRYCANNCPYKVRRFNWFDYNYAGQMKYPMTLSQNPEVTIRSRGIMEKCTFCTQRIQEAKNVAKDMGRLVKDGEIKTACQQSCPADAITFGNINDEQSKVAQTAKDTRGYHVLEELNIRPSITYLTKIRNTEELV